MRYTPPRTTWFSRNHVIYFHPLRLPIQIHLTNFSFSSTTSCEVCLFVYSLFESLFFFNHGQIHVVCGIWTLIPRLSCHPFEGILFAGSHSCSYWGSLCTFYVGNMTVHCAIPVLATIIEPMNVPTWKPMLNGCFVSIFHLFFIFCSEGLWRGLHGEWSSFLWWKCRF